eukprot:scaffold69747_cov21-Prasinocladus_malaysianus.AAC.1
MTRYCGAFAVSHSVQFANLGSPIYFRLIGLGTKYSDCMLGVIAVFFRYSWGGKRSMTKAEGLSSGTIIRVIEGEWEN